MATLWDRLLRRAIYPGGYNESYYTGAEYVAVDDTPGGLKERSVAGMVRTAREAYAANGIVFGCQAMRMMLISEARFKFQRMTDDTMFGNTDLFILEHPWPNGDTGDLLKRIEQDGAMGNAFYRRVDPPGGDRSLLVEMRPEAVTIISQIDHDGYGRPYRHVIGYAEDMGPGTEPSFFTTDEVSHFAPLPDPFARTRGMSWITPIMREVYSDSELTKYKSFHLANGAQPGLVVKYSSRLSDKIVDTLRKRLRARYGGPENAGNVLVLDEGADAMVTGSTLEQLQFDAVTKAGERRVASAANVPLEILGLEKGDYQTAIRRMADLWARPTWRMICASLEHLVPTSAPQAVPVRLWFDVGGVAALREGELQRAQGFLVKAQGMAASIAAGMKRESAIAAATGGDLSLLVPDPDAPPPGTSARLTGKDTNAPGQPAAQPPTGGPAGTTAGRPQQAGKPQNLPGVGGKNLPNALPASAKAAVAPGGAAPKPITAGAKRSAAEEDAERLVEYLAWVHAGGGLLDMGLLESSRSEAMLASDNEQAWALVQEDPRFIGLGLTALEARMLTDGHLDSATRANWNPRLHPRDPNGKFAGGTGGLKGGNVTAVKALDPFYNEIPETRGTGRNKGEFGGQGGRASQDTADIAAWRQGHPVAPPITAAEARDGSRPVSAAEFQELARQGLNEIGITAAQRQPTTGLTSNLNQIKADTFAKVTQPWGGATIDPRTGQPLPDGADKYALTVKPKGMDPISIPEGASAAEFNAAMDKAMAEFSHELGKGKRYLGVFHDDDEGRIDIDPVMVVDTRHEVETIGAYTHAIGGAYHFATGDGFWPPHVAEPGQGVAA